MLRYPECFCLWNSNYTLCCTYSVTHCKAIARVPTANVGRTLGATLGVTMCGM
uniref:Uncharacterized protein n=1 Tax=Anguilla anguilla TaxID=7936 RepID=A0A0E9UQL3_ANGAN